MSRNDIIRIAQEAGFRVNTTESLLEELERFAALVASAEREACAKSLEQAAEAAKDADPQGFVWIAIKTSAEGIRERGKQ
jgi:hypothetical protein